MKRLIPAVYAAGIDDIPIQQLKDRGIKVFLLDIDNTLAATGDKTPSLHTADWIRRVQGMGIHVALVSNNSKKRVDNFNQELGLFTVHRAYKPLRRGIAAAAAHFKAQKSELCMIGDQIFTDVWAANAAGIHSVLVMPFSQSEGLGVRMKRSLERLILKRHRMDTYCLIGNPVSHSKSPLLHHIVYHFYDIKARYLLCHAHPDELGQVVRRLKDSGVLGFNVTVPYKKDIIPFLDEISDDARQIGSVNTVKIKNGRLCGYNTDGGGFVRQLLSNGTVIADSRIKLIGAGGSAPSIVHALLANGAQQITVYNRTLDRAKEIAAPYPAVTPLPLEEFTAGDCDILINTTSVGLSPHTDASPVESLEGISPHTEVYDIIYSPPVTKLMRQAAENGCRAYNGYKLLIYQGLLADELWFDRPLINERLVSKIQYELGDR